jgi:hypothetical protein
MSSAAMRMWWGGFVWDCRGVLADSHAGKINNKLANLAGAMGCLSHRRSSGIEVRDGRPALGSQH